MNGSFVKVAAGVPKIRVADCRHNGEQVIGLMKQAAKQEAKVLVLPELCLTGCTCGDLFRQDALLDGAAAALSRILEETAALELLALIGLPVKREGNVFNCAALLCRGKLLAVTAKEELTLEERRWFTSGENEKAVFHSDLLPGVSVGVSFGPCVGALDADLILSPSADPEYSGQGEVRRRLLAVCSRRLGCTLVRATAGDGESTTDLVYGGHSLIVRGGKILAQRRFEPGLAVCEVDLCRLPAQEVPSSETAAEILPLPFLPPTEEGLEEALTIAALGLKKRLEHTVAPAVIGLSGGLDSTLALLTTVRAFDRLGRKRTDITAVTMPCFGTTVRTRTNAERLAEVLGVTLRTIDITAAVRQHFADIGLDEEDRSATFENGQARERTQVLMDVANTLGGLVIGTGDLSELALGWCTYNGDHMSMYAVNCGMPKTLVRRLTQYEADRAAAPLRAVLRDILDTPVSPELLPPAEGQIAQKTEELVGPYELHDFYLYYAIGKGLRPRQVLEAAEKTWGSRYDRTTLLKWLKSFYRRFFTQQFKRSCLPDGPRVTELTLSPRGGWQMPSDAAAALWLNELEELEIHE